MRAIDLSDLRPYFDDHDSWRACVVEIKEWFEADYRPIIDSGNVIGATLSTETMTNMLAQRFAGKDGE